MENGMKKPLLPSPNFLPKKFQSPYFASSQNVVIKEGNEYTNIEESANNLGATIPAKYLEKYKSHIEIYKQKFKETYNKTNTNDFQRKLWCKSCELSFKNQVLLDKHMGDYKTCSINDCFFKGCSKSLAKHIEELHSTGLYEKIKNLNTPEEIAKWREERRKRYPTVTNVQLRQKAQEERKKRGELLQNSKSRFAPRNERKKINRGVHNEMKRKNSNEINQHKNKRKRPTQEICPNKDENRQKKMFLKVPHSEDTVCYDEDENETFNNSLPKFAGTSSIPNYEKIGVEKNVRRNALTGLIGMYGDSSDSEENFSISEEESCQMPNIPKNISNEIVVIKEESKIHSDQNAKDVACTSSEISSKTQKNEILGESKENYCFHNSRHGTSLKVENPIPQASAFETNIKTHTSSFEINRNSSKKESSSILIKQRILKTEICGTEAPKMLTQAVDNVSCQERKTNEDNDDDDEMPEEQPILRTDSSAYENSFKKTNENTVDFQEKTEKPLLTGNKNKQYKTRAKVRQVGSLLDYSKLRKTNQNTLLEKLLEPHIRHERNVLLQCVRYVVENDFFGIGKSK